ncbi:MAG: TrmH family RNA methyltransferase [Bacteroidales bacterium]|nr:TrmH family RNA methyltransferase [Candidatus Colicola faecequi]
MHKLTIEEMHRLTPEQFREVGKVPLIVVLDNVRSQHNVGAVFRTADAFRLAGVYLCGISGIPSPVEGAPLPTRAGMEEIHKTALGAEQTVDWRYFAKTEDAVSSLQNDGYTVFAIEQVEGSTKLQDVKLEKDGKYAIVMGHEVFGVSQKVVDMTDGCIEIPQYGTKHSLNVSVTAGIVMYTLAAQLLP